MAHDQFSFNFKVFRDIDFIFPPQKSSTLNLNNQANFYKMMKSLEEDEEYFDWITFLVILPPSLIAIGHTHTHYSIC